MRMMMRSSSEYENWVEEIRELKLASFSAFAMANIRTLRISHTDMGSACARTVDESQLHGDGKIQNRRSRCMGRCPRFGLDERRCGDSSHSPSRTAARSG